MNRTWHETHEENMTVSEIFAEFVTKNIASDASFIAHTIVFVSFLISPLVHLWSWGTMLLVFTTSVSIEAIYLCLFLQRSSNMHGDRDRIQAQADYDTNREAKREIELFQKSLYRLETRKIDLILKAFTTHRIPVIDLQPIPPGRTRAMRSKKPRAQHSTAVRTSRGKRQGR